MGLLTQLLVQADPANATSPALRSNRSLPPLREAGAQVGSGRSELSEYTELAEPLVAVSGRVPSEEEDRSLLIALKEFRATFSLTGLKGFASTFPASRWTPSVQVNLGLLQRDRGYFSEALASWRSAWESLRSCESSALQALADRAFAELTEQLARFGRQAEVVKLLQEIDGRRLLGSAAQKVYGAREGLGSMRRNPERSFLCGSLALSQVRSSLGLPADEGIETAESPTEGFSLTQLERLARRSGLPALKVKRDSPSRKPPLPCVVHWKVGHFGALIRESGDRVLLKDLTFKHDLWLDSKAIESEASGYFLLMADKAPEGFALIEDLEGGNIQGKGNSAAGSPDLPGPEVGGDGDCDKGMATYTIRAMPVSVSISDTPIGYEPPRGPPIHFTISYDQREANQPANFAYSNLGRNWTFNWLSWVLVSQGPKGVARIYSPGGTIEQFVSEYTDDRSYTFDGSYVPNRDSGAELVQLAERKYQRRAPDGSSRVYSLPGQGGALFLTEVRDAAGNAVFLHYDDQIRLRAIQDAIGQVTTLFYELPSDPLKVTSVVDPFGRKARFAYDAQGELVSATDVIGLTSRFTGGSAITQLTTPYGITRFDWTEDPDNHYRYLTVTDPQGGKEVAWFIGFNNIAQRPLVDEPNFVPGGMNGSARDMGGRNTFFFNKKATAQGAHLALDGSKAHIFHWMHAKDNQSCSHLLESEKPPLAARIFYNYDSNLQFGKDTTIKLARPTAVGRTINLGPRGSHESQTTAYAYNAIGNLTLSIDQLGRRQQIAYAPNQIDPEKIWRVGAKGLELLAAYTWNDHHRPLSMVDAAGQTTYLSYNSYGQLTQTTNALREVTSFEYDPDGYLIRVVGSDPSAVSTFSYDAYGRVRTTTDPDGYLLTYEYDLLDRLTRVTYPDASFEQFVYNRLDNEGTRDRAGRWTRTTFNALRQPEEVVDALDRTNRFSWCGCGSLEAITDAEGRLTRWERDVLGRLVSKTFHDGTRNELEYEPETGRLSLVRDAKRQETHYSYNRDDTIRSITYSNAVVATPSVFFYYDTTVRRLLRMVDAQGETKYSYNPIASATALGADRLAEIDGPLLNDTVSYSYDALGRITNRAIGGLGARVGFDSLGRAREIQNALGRFAYDYVDASSRIRRIGYPNQHESLIEYYGNEGDLGVKRITHHKSDGAPLAQYDYTYDAAGLIQNWVQRSAARAPETSRYEYDSGYQLRSVTRQDASGRTLGESSHRYDRAGNRLIEQRGSWLATANADTVNQLQRLSPGGRLQVKGRLSEHARVKVAGQDAAVRPNLEFSAEVPTVPGNNQFEVVASDGTGNSITNNYQGFVTGPEATQFLYDANGNCTNRSSLSQVAVYEWDAADNLIAITRGHQRSEFFYDGFGRRVRIRERQDGQITEDRLFVWCGLELCEEREFKAPGVSSKRFFPQGVQVGTNVYLYLRDHLGSIRGVTDASGALRGEFDYDSFGGILSSAGDIKPDFGFTGHFQHSPTGLLLAPYRAYDPSTGRWIGRDPGGESGGLNLFAYALNNPINAIDPDGGNPVALLRGALLVGRFAGGAAAGAYFAWEGDWSDVAEGALVGGVSAIAPGAGAILSDAILGIRATTIILQGNCASFEKKVYELVDLLSGRVLGAGVSRLKTVRLGVAAKGGRLGNQATRDHVADVAKEMESRGWNITHGGGRLPEEYLPGPGGGRLGSSFPDITATKNGRTLRVNTIDTRANGITPTTREAANAARIRSQTPGDHLLLVPKP